MKVAPWKWFGLLATARIASALLNPIADCDETFNFWEPAHYILHSDGLQPWEYSPQYGLRSYQYIALHATVAKLLSLFLNKEGTFFGLRIALGLACALCEMTFLSGIARQFGGRIAALTCAMLTFSPGMFIASTALLPTSFCMYCFLLAFGYWYRHEANMVFSVVTLGGVAAVLGWPFAALCMVPPALHFLAQYGLWVPLKTALLTFPFICAGSLVVDTFYYGRLVFSAWSIVSYNVFGSGEGVGSELYGIEPWYFFYKNLALNFNVAFLCALLAPFAVVLQVVSRYFSGSTETASASLSNEGVVAEPTDTLRRRNKAQTKGQHTKAKSSQSHSTPLSGSNGVPRMEWLMYLGPFFIWFGFWHFPAHKEERFMTPVYPMLLLSAAVGLDCMAQMLQGLWQLVTGNVKKKPSGRIAALVCVVALVPFGLLSVSRIGAVSTFYSAPMKSYMALTRSYRQEYKDSGPQLKVCVGKEWYRFPSHFLLHPNLKLYFIPSDFKGLLPTRFMGTRKVHHELNNRNEGVPNLPSMANLSECDFVVDLELSDQKELRFSADPSTWEVIDTQKFLDASQSPMLSRALYIPKYSHAKNTYAPYLVFKRIKKDFPHRVTVYHM